MAKWTIFDNCVLVSADGAPGNPDLVLAAGRVHVYPADAAEEMQARLGGPVDVADIAAALRALRDEVASRFVAMDEAADAVAHAMAAGEHLFFLGPPGTAKSTLARTFAQGIGGRFWRIVLNPDTAREEVFGPVDPVAFAREGRWERRWAGLATAHVALLDEIFKASPQVINMLLDALEERRVASAHGDRPIPLITAITASNEAPEERELRAAWDRLLVRLSMDYIHDPDDFLALLRADAGRTPIRARVDVETLPLLAAAAELQAMALPDEVKEGLMDLWMELGQDGRAVSNRRWVRTAKLVAAAALMAGEEPDIRHLGVARWTLWQHPDEERDIRNLVLSKTDPLAAEVIDMEALLADLKVQKGNLDSQDLAARAELTGKARQLQTRAQRLLGKPGAQRVARRIQQVAREAEAMVEDLLNTFMEEI